MELRDYLPFWERLTEEQQRQLTERVTHRRVPAGTQLHSGADSCEGLFLVLSGQLRVYTVSEEGREITLYRLFERDICLFSAACILRSAQFELSVSAERETEYLHIPAELYGQIMLDSAPAANYTNELMAARFSEVMWVMDQVLSKRMDSRVAALLLEESALAESETLSVTHEMLARHLGTAREVISRMLKYFQSEGMVSLSRGGITLCDMDRLRELAQNSMR